MAAAHLKDKKALNPDATVIADDLSNSAGLGEPIVLAIDSAGSGCSVLVAAGETVLATERCSTERGQAERLLPMVDAVVHNSGLSAVALDIVGTTIGPGSFTGIRVGLAAVRGIALATGANPIGVTSFEAVAAGLAPQLCERGTGFLLVALESRLQDLYIQLFDHAHRPLRDPRAAMPAALDEMLNGLIGAAPLVVAGDAAQRAANMLMSRPSTIIIEHSAPNAVGVLRAMLRLARAGGGRINPSPLYLRPPGVTVSTAHQGGGR